MSEGLTDDPTIEDADILFRGLQADWIVPGESGRMRIASAAFKNEELSVLIRSVLAAVGRNENDAFTACPGVSLCSFTVALARSLAQNVVRDGDPPNDSAHGLVVGKKNKTVANRLAREALWVVPPEPPSISD